MLTRVQIIERLEAIETDLAERQPDLQKYAESWTRQKREKEKKWAEAYMQSDAKEVTTRKAAAIRASEGIGVEDEANYTALSKVCDVLNTRAMIGMALLKSHDRVESVVPSGGRVYGSERAS